MNRTSLNLLVLAAGLAGFSCQAQERVKIGFMSPVTGPQASYGTDNRDGALLAIKEINAKGLKVGGKPVQLELEVNDDGADPRQGVQVAQKLVDSKIRFVLGPYNSGVTMPTTRVFGDAGVLVLTVASNPRITSQGPVTNLFRIGATDNQLGAKMAVYAGQDLKVKTVAVIDDRTAYGQGVAQEFVNQAGKLGIKVVAKEFTNDKASDFSTILTSVKAAKPDAVFYGGYSAQAGPMLRQMRALGITTPLLGGDGICSSETAALSQLTTELNVYCTQGGSIIDRSDKGKKFVERYRAAFKRDPLTYAAAFYDGAYLIASAMEATQSTDPAKIGAHLAKSSHAGVAGEYAYDDRHDLKQSAVTVFTFKGKEVVALKSL